MDKEIDLVHQHDVFSNELWKEFSRNIQFIVYKIRNTLMINTNSSTVQKHAATIIASTAIAHVVPNSKGQNIEQKIFQDNILHTQKKVLIIKVFF